MKWQYFYEIDESQISKEAGKFSIESYLRGVSDYASLCTGGVLVLDFKERRLLLVSTRDIFLCGNTCDKAQRLGYGFFSETVHEDDIPLLIQIHRAILNSPYIADKDRQAHIAYFYFTVRMKEYYQSHEYEKQRYSMICFKMKPVFVNEKIRYGICVLTISGMLDSGNLCIYFDNTKQFDKYSFSKRIWETQEGFCLTKRDQMILRLAKHGQDQQQIADELGLTYNRIRHIIPEIYEKLGAKNMEQAIVIASNHLKLYDHR
jgi:DNA-binding CsgD family transcriptional regulator